MKKHIMVCTSSKSKILGGGCCYDKGGEELWSKIQACIKEKGLENRIVAKRAACMSNCKSGISVRTFPDRKIHNHFQAQDIDAFLSKYQK